MNTIINVAGYKIQTPITDHVGKIIDFEQGELSKEEVIELFQYLIDTGLAWQLQGFYGRTARDLIEQGYCFRADDLNRPGVIEGQEVIELKALPAGE